MTTVWAKAPDRRWYSEIAINKGADLEHQAKLGVTGYSIMMTGV
jgi:hypothetical protein